MFLFGFSYFVHSVAALLSCGGSELIIKRMRQLPLLLPLPQASGHWWAWGGGGAALFKAQNQKDR